MVRTEKYQEHYPECSLFVRLLYQSNIILLEELSTPCLDGAELSGVRTPDAGPGVDFETRPKSGREKGAVPDDRSPRWSNFKQTEEVYNITVFF